MAPEVSAYLKEALDYIQENSSVGYTTPTADECIVSELGGPCTAECEIGALQLSNRAAQQPYSGGKKLLTTR